MNDTMSKILGQLQEIGDPLPEQSPREESPEDEVLPPFCFSQNKDRNGLPFEHKLYVKKNCKNCYERGYVIQIMNGRRRYQHCGCVVGGYAKMRRAFEDRVKDIMAGYVGSDPEYARKQVEAAVVKELLG